MAETPEEVLAEVIDIHRVRPNRGTCSCGWEADDAKTSPVNPRAAPAPGTRRTPSARDFFRHLVDEQCRALRSSGLLPLFAGDDDPGHGARGG